MFSTIAVIFGLFNFTLFIPLLDLLFNTVELPANAENVEFSLSITGVKNWFSGHFSVIIASRGKTEALKFLCLVIFASVLFSNVFKFLSQKVLTTVRTRLVQNLRNQVYDRLLEQDLSFFHKRRKGELLSTLSNDVHEIENSVVSSIQMIFREPLMIIGFFYLLFALSAKLTLFTLILLPLSFLLIAEITRRLKHDARKSQDILGRLTSILEETLSGIRVIKGFTAEKFASERFKNENASYRKTLKSMLNKREMASPMSEFMGVSVLTLIFFYGGSLVIQNQSELSASEFITYIILYSQILIPAKNITTAVTNIQKGMVSGERIFSILDEDVDVKEVNQAFEIRSFENCIEIVNLHFSHPGKKVLKNINLKIQKGKTIALVGPSGAGKSTLADLLPRFYDPENGTISLDGMSLRTIQLRSLRKLFGIVSQDSILFHDSIRNNIAFGLKGVSDEQIIDAAKTANAWEFIQSSPDGLDTIIGDQGSRLSGGQKQRISIARAVLRNPPILILDEATSALDSESEKLVRESLSIIMKGRTSIVIAHRLSTIKDADLIVAMQDGEIVETGTHAALSEKNGLYRRLLDLQGFND